MVQLSCPYMTTRKTVALTIGNFVSKVMSLLFNTMSSFIIKKCLSTKDLIPLNCSVGEDSNFGHQIRRVDALEKTLALGKIEDRRRRERQRKRWLNDITD